MFEFVTVIGGIIGGLGLFLLAVKMITDGLKLAAGHMLRDLLSRWTSTPARGIASGLAITAIVQSSSAVTLATIGFVNAGFLSLYQALGVVFGANIGTTMTGWLVVVVGFKFKVELFALPLIGIGMMMRLGGAGRRLGAIGEALTGFGLFFIGIDILQNSFAGLVNYIELERLTTEGVTGVLTFLLAGFLLTTFTQSSSAAIAIVLTAATGGVLSLTSAATMVIGANVGTTTTAALAVIGATSNAKRVAAAHITFNLLTAILALLLLPLMLWMVKMTSDLLGLEDIPAVTLALFHTTFNVLGVMLLWPFSERLAAFLGTRFTTREEIESSPRFLDKTVLVSPMLALDALVMELQRVSAMTRKMAMGALSAEFAYSRKLQTDHQTVDALIVAIEDFVTQLERVILSKDVVERLPNVLRAAQYFSSAVEIICAIAEQEFPVDSIRDEDLSARLSRFKANVVSLLTIADINNAEFSLTEAELRLQNILAEYNRLKPDLLEAGAQGHIEIRRMSELLDQISRIRRMADQYLKGNRTIKRLSELASAISAAEAHEDKDQFNSS